MRPAAAALSAALFAVSTSVYAQDAPGVGFDPTLPKPQSSLVPTVNIAPATSWPQGSKPTAASGLDVAAFATGLDHPRWLTCCPTATCWSRRPTRRPSQQTTGIKGWFMKPSCAACRCRRAQPQPHHAAARCRRRWRGRGAQGVPRGPQLALRHGAGRRQAVRRQHRCASCASRIWHGQTQIGGRPQGRRPAGRADQPPLDQEPHRQRRRHAISMSASARTATSAKTASTKENDRAAISRSTADGAKGSSPPACATPTAWPGSRSSGALWMVVNERDEIGNDLVPDYLTVVKRRRLLRLALQLLRPACRRAGEAAGARAGGKRDRAGLRAGPHVAPLGLAFYTGSVPAAIPRRRFHRSARLLEPQAASGYKVVFVPFEQASPAGQPMDVLTGFVDADGEAQRPPGRRGVDQQRRAAGGRRCRQHHMAGDAGKGRNVTTKPFAVSSGIQRSARSAKSMHI